MLRSVALGADEDADDAGVAVPGRRVQRRVAVVVLDVRPAAAQQEHLQTWDMIWGMFTAELATVPLLGCVISPSRNLAFALP